MFEGNNLIEPKPNLNLITLEGSSSEPCILLQRKNEK